MTRWRFYAGVGLALTVAACSSDDGADDGTGDAADDGSDVCLDPSCLGEALPAFTIENPTSVPRDGWARIALPFPRGAVGDPGLVADVAADGALGELVPIKWHYDAATGERHSLAIGMLHVPIALAPGERKTITPQLAPAGLEPFAPGAALATWLAAAVDGNHAWIEVDLADGTYRASLVGAQVADVQSSRASVTRRYRTPLVKDGATHPLAVTAYFTLDAGRDTGELVVLIGNDTFERPVGGQPIVAARLHVRAPLAVAFRMPEAHGAPTPTIQGDVTSWPLLANTELGDGVAAPARLRFAVGGDPATLLADAATPLVGLASAAAWNDARALGPWGTVPALRSGDPAAARTGLASGCTDPLVGTGTSYLGYVNQAPPSTGAQPDFTSNVPVFALQALQAETICPLRHAQIAVDREALRPSFWWIDRGGVVDRIRHDDFPEAMFWVGRPHYDASWNQPYPLVAARASTPKGQTHGWESMDDQHYGNNAVRTVYELTGDGYLRDLLRAHQSLLTWGYFTGWANNTSAERAARLMKEAVLLYALDDEAPAAAEMKRRAIKKNRDVYLAKVTASRAMYPAPAIATVVNDGRVELTVEYPGQEVSMAWQTGFHMEFQRLALIAGWDPATADTIARTYLAAAPTAFFDATSGQPTTYFLMSDPTQRDVGGIGETWWSGWLAIAQHLPDAEGAAVVLTHYKARLAQAIETAGVDWDGDDAWHAP